MNFNRFVDGFSFGLVALIVGFILFGLISMIGWGALIMIIPLLTGLINMIFKGK